MRREVLLEGLQHRRRVERRGRVVDRVERDAATADERLLRAAVHARDPGRLAGEELRGEVPERGHELRRISSSWRKRWLSQASISSGCGSRFPGGLHLRTFAMYTSLRVRPMPSRSLSSSFPAEPDERIALLVLVEAGRLADEHQVGVRVADAVDDLGAPLRQPAARAGGGLGGVRLERGPAAQGVGLSSHRPRRSNRRRRRHAGRSRTARRCQAREPRTRRAAAPPARRRSRDRPDRLRSSRRAPRSATRTPCTRTRRSASPTECRQVPGRTATGGECAVRDDRGRSRIGRASLAPGARLRRRVPRRLRRLRLFGLELWPLTGWRLFSQLRTDHQVAWRATAVGEDGEKQILAELPRAYRNFPLVMRTFSELPPAEQAAVPRVARGRAARAAGTHTVRLYRIDWYLSHRHGPRDGPPPRFTLLLAATARRPMRRVERFLFPGGERGAARGAPDRALRHPRRPPRDRAVPRAGRPAAGALPAHLLHGAPAGDAAEARGARPPGRWRPRGRPRRARAAHARTRSRSRGRARSSSTGCWRAPGRSCTTTSCSSSASCRCSPLPAPTPGRSMPGGPAGPPRRAVAPLRLAAADGRDRRRGRLLLRRASRSSSTPGRPG